MNDRAENIRQIKKLAEEKPPRTKLINSKSEKRKVEERIYLNLREYFLQDNRKCMFPGCTKKAKDVHHSCGKVGKNYTDISTFVALCRDHHRFVEWNPKEAKKLLLSKSRLTKNSAEGDLSPTLEINLK